MKSFDDLLSTRSFAIQRRFVGHSDGGSIAIIHAGDSGSRVRGLILEAPHVFVEEVGLESIRAIAEVYREEVQAGCLRTARRDAALRRALRRALWFF